MSLNLKFQNYKFTPPIYLSIDVRPLFVKFFFSNPFNLILDPRLFYEW